MIDGAGRLQFLQVLGVQGSVDILWVLHLKSWSTASLLLTAGVSEAAARTSCREQPGQVSQHGGVNEAGGCQSVVHVLNKRRRSNVPRVFLDYRPVWCRGCEGIRGSSWGALNCAEMRRISRHDGTSAIH